MNANAIRRRSGTLDSLRGLTLVSMMAYHACWDLVYLRGLPWAWYNGFWAYIWQQSICCTFILLSGYCCQASRHPIRRGAISFFGGAAVSLASAAPRRTVWPRCSLSCCASTLTPENPSWYWAAALKRCWRTGKG